MHKSTLQSLKDYLTIFKRLSQNTPLTSGAMKNRSHT